MLASWEAFLEVVVLLLRLAALFSWMMMVTMSPMAWAFLSANMERGWADISCQSEPAPAWSRADDSSSSTSAASLKGNEDGLFIFYLSVKFVVGFRVADANCLAGQAVLEGFHLEGDAEGALLVNAIHDAAAQDGGAHVNVPV